MQPFSNGIVWKIVPCVFYCVFGSVWIKQIPWITTHHVWRVWLVVFTAGYSLGSMWFGFVCIYAYMHVSLFPTWISCVMWVNPKSHVWESGLCGLRCLHLQIHSLSMRVLLVCVCDTCELPLWYFLVYTHTSNMGISSTSSLALLHSLSYSDSNALIYSISLSFFTLKEHLASSLLLQ